MIRLRISNYKMARVVFVTLAFFVGGQRHPLTRLSFDRMDGYNYYEKKIDQYYLLEVGYRRHKDTIFLQKPKNPLDKR
jgi:hypothetical protein